LMQVFALQELAASWAGKDWEQAERFAKEIPAAQAEARAFALIQAGTGGNIPAEKAAGILKSALEEASRIEDGFLAQKATARILAAMAASAPREAGRHLPRIHDPLLRSEVEAVLTERMADQNPEEALKVSGHIPGEFQRARSVLKILNKKFPRDVEAANSLFQEAKKAGGNVSEPYSRALFLADLGRSWGRIDRAREAAAYEEALIACKEISSPSLKAEALETLSSAWKNSDKARAQAALEAVDPAVFRAREMAAEIRLWARTDFGKARQAAESIPGNFPVEKAQALKELGAAVKKVQPALGIEIFEKALASALAIPEGGSKEKILTQILGEAASLDADKVLAMAQTVSDREMKDRLLKETGMGLTKDESPAALSGALKIAKAISESSLRTPVYQKAADRLAKGPAKGNGADPTILAALSAWGKAREAARLEETEAAPVFERALGEIGKISEAKERAFLLAAMIGDWAQAEEGRAFKAAETIAPDMAEALSYGLLQAGVQFRKWSRKEAEGAFEKTLKAAEKISDSHLQGKRMMQIAREWQLFNPEKGKEVLRKAAEPPQSAYARAKSVLDWAKLFYKESIDNQLKALEKATQLAQENKHPILLSESSLIWSNIDWGKSQEVIGQIDSKEARVKALCAAAGRKAKSDPALTASLLERASREALTAEGLQEKIAALRGVAAEWARLDKSKARETYQVILQTAEKADSASAGFANR
jgi:hypothetical protein